MARLFTTLLALAGAAVAAAEPSSSSAALRGHRALAPVTDTFMTPKVNDVRVDFCYGYDFRMGPNNPAAYLECGQGSADAYCKAIGYDAATAFVKDEQIAEPTIYILQMTNNPAPLKDAFKSITCTKANGNPTVPPVNANPTVPAEQMTWRYPRISADGPRLDWCAGYDTRVGGIDNPAGFLECGQGAADLFCKKHGYTKAVRFGKQEGVTNEDSMYILQNTVNPNPKRDMFSFITCGK